MTPEEVLAQLRVGQKGNPEEQAAAMAVLAAVISDSQRLGKLVISSGNGSWTRPQLRNPLSKSKNSHLPRPLN